MKNRKLYIIFIFLFVNAEINCRAQGTWEVQSTPTSAFLKSICFVDSLYGWAAGEEGVIIHTSDGGDHWDVQQSTTDNEISTIFFLNRDLGWAAAYNYSSPPYGTLLLKTTNGGLNWEGEAYPEENYFITTILYFDSLNGWMGARPHALLHTTNGGLSWQTAEVDTSTLAFFPVLKIRFLNQQIGYASGGMHDIAGVIWRTYNGGQKWYAIDPMYAPSDEIYGLHIVDSLHVLATGGDPDFTYGVSMLRTADGGNTWEYEEPGIQGSTYGLEFRTASEAWCPLGQLPKLLFSQDGGNTWETMDTPESSAVIALCFPDSLHGFAAGMNGVVLAYSPPNQVVVQKNKNQSRKFILEQNIPNPCSTNTRIGYTIPSGKFTDLQLEVFNYLGKPMLSYQDKNRISGRHELKIDISSWPHGLYFYFSRIYYSSGKVVQSETKKMVIKD